MKYHILTLFPDMVLGGLRTSIIGRAEAKGLLELDAVDFPVNRCQEAGIHLGKAAQFIKHLPLFFQKAVRSQQEAFHALVRQWAAFQHFLNACRQGFHSFSCMFSGGRDRVQGQLHAQAFPGGGA